MTNPNDNPIIDNTIAKIKPIPYDQSTGTSFTFPRMVTVTDVNSGTKNNRIAAKPNKKVAGTNPFLVNNRSKAAISGSKKAIRFRKLNSI